MRRSIESDKKKTEHDWVHMLGDSFPKTRERPYNIRRICTLFSKHSKNISVTTNLLSSLAEIHNAPIYKVNDLFING